MKPQQRLQPVRVLFLDHVPRMSGAEQSLADLVIGLKQGPIEPVVCLPSDGPLATELRAHGVLVRMVPMSQRMLETSRVRLSRHPLLAIARAFAFLAAAFRIWRLIREVKPSIVHTNTLKSHLLATLPCLAARVPLVWHLRDILPKGWLLRGLMVMANLATVIIVPSRAVAEPFRGRRRLLRKLRLIPNGIRVQEFQDAAKDRSLREMFGVNNGDPVIGIVGRIAPWKGQDVFLRAAAMLANRHPRAHFAIIGAVLFPENDIPFEQHLHRMAMQLGIEDRVTFCGWQPAPESMAAIDVFVHASLEPEPFGRAIVEAMAAGKPVVAAAGGAVTEIVPPAAGFVVPPAHPELLADALDRLLSDKKLRQRMGEAGAAVADSFFPVQRTVHSVAGVYRTLVQLQVRRAAKRRRMMKQLGVDPDRVRAAIEKRRDARKGPELPAWQFPQPSEMPSEAPRPGRAPAQPAFEPFQPYHRVEEQRPRRAARRRAARNAIAPHREQVDPAAFRPEPFTPPHDDTPPARDVAPRDFSPPRDDAPPRDFSAPTRDAEPFIEPFVAPEPDGDEPAWEPPARAPRPQPKRTVAARAPKSGMVRTARIAQSVEAAVAEPSVATRPVAVSMPAPAPVRVAEPLPAVVRPKPLYDALKRALDLTIALTVLIVGSPLWILIAVLIKLESQGPAMHRGVVVGRNCKPFTYFKFRSMRIDGDDKAHRRFIERYVRENGGHEHDGEIVYKLLGDDRITSVGRWIRTFSLDEIPQLINVVRGEMSIVGPRPPLDYEFEHYDDAAKMRLAVKPGITGMQQVWHRHSASFDEKLRMDMDYIQRRSLWLDVKLIAHTIIAIPRGH